ncbi:MAG: diguanylate cyclase, partial [Anaerolineae bacterium]
AIRRLPPVYHRQIKIILAACMVPLATDLLYTFKLTPHPEIEPVPLAFLVTGALISYGMFGEQLLNLSPIARARLVDVVHDLMIVVDQRGQITDLNHIARQHLGLEHVARLPIPITAEQWPDLHQWVTEATDRLSEKHILPSPDGRQYEIQGFPLPTAAQPEGWLLVLRDITEQLKLEQDLRASEALHRAISENAYHGIAVVQDGRFQLCNSRLSEMLETPQEEIIGQDIFQFLAPSHYDEVRQRYQRRTQGSEEPPRYHTMLKSASGREFPAELNISEVVYHGEPALLVYVRDMTSQVLREEFLQKQARQQRLLNEITKAVIQSGNLEETLNILADRLGELLYADHCLIALWDEEKHSAQVAAASAGHSLTLGKQVTTLTQIAFEQQKPLIIEDSEQSPLIDEEFSQRFPLRSMLVIPLQADNHKLGAALIAFTQPHTFTGDEISLGEQVGQQIGLAIYKSYLLEEAHRRAVEAETLRQASLLVTSTLQLEQAIHHILQQLREVVPYDSASVQLLHGEELEIVGQYGFTEPEKIIGMRFSTHADNPNSIVIQTRQPHVLQDAPLAYNEFSQPPHDHIRGWMGVPLIVQDRIIGMLALDSRTPNRFTPDHVRMASAFAAHVAIALENARLYEYTHQLAITDSLTGLFNRRHFMEIAQREHQRALRYRRPLAVIMMDLDHFKRVNDKHGHLIGDQVLRATALVCLDHLRETDVMARYGGEEFVFLLPETNGIYHPHENASAAVAERLRQVIADNAIKTQAGEIHITASLGVADLSPEKEKLETLINRADHALYVAKQRGRNRVVTWTPDLPPISNGQFPSH